MSKVTIMLLYSLVSSSYSNFTMVKPAIKERYLRAPVSADLEEKMVFIGGPRQVGKTTFATSFLSPPGVSHNGYLSWDDTKTRRALMRGELPPSEPLLVLDEVHKFARWRNMVKGFYDINKERTAFIVTGSARLDHYRAGGDSLQGRYHYYRLHPFTLPEIDPSGSQTTVDDLLVFGGFPEPLLKGDQRFSRRWRREHQTRVVSEDLRDLENVREISLIELLVAELPMRVGSPLSVKNLAGLLQIAHATAERWISILERLYVCFRISPFGSKRIRAVKKEQKLYFWDWSAVPEDGPRFENMVASHLLKYCHYLEDTEGFETELRYIRDVDRREVDFVLLKEGSPLFAVECKLGERAPSSHIRYFKERTPIPLFFQVHRGTADWLKEGVRCLPFAKFCSEAGLV